MIKYDKAQRITLTDCRAQRSPNGRRVDPMRDVFKASNCLRHLLKLHSNLGLKFNGLVSETICDRNDASDEQGERLCLKRL